MNILFLCSSFYPHIGGVEKHSFEVAKRLRKKGHKVVVITEDSTKDRRDSVNGITIYRLYFGKKGWVKKFKIWLKLFKYRRLFLGANIVHCHDVFFWYIPFRFLFIRKKVFTTFHGYETRFPLENKVIFIRKISEKLSFGNICVGNYIEKWYGTKPNFITWGAIDKAPKSVKNNFSTKKIKILFIGRIEKDNGVEIYSNVLDKLKIRYTFQACGDGSLKDKFKKFGKVNGFIKDVETYIKLSDIIFASSYLSILTAMAFRKPIFSVYQNPLKRDYLSMTPFSKFIINSNSSRDLIKKINLLVKNNKLRENKTNKGYDWVKGETWSKVTDLYLRLYKI